MRRASYRSSEAHRSTNRRRGYVEPPTYSCRGMRSAPPPGGAAGSSARLADRDRAIQIITNLVGNAIKFTPKGGTIRVGGRLSQDSVRLHVSDTGPGIGAADMPHIFERYWRSRMLERSGSGLGLYIARGMVKHTAGKFGPTARKSARAPPSSSRSRRLPGWPIQERKANDNRRSSAKFGRKRYRPAASFDHSLDDREPETRTCLPRDTSGPKEWEEGLTSLVARHTNPVVGHTHFVHGRYNLARISTVASTPERRYFSAFSAKFEGPGAADLLDTLRRPVLRRGAW